MSLTFKMWLPVIIVSVITIISMIIAKIVTDEDTWVFGVFFVGALLFAIVLTDGSCETADTDKNELNSDVPLGEITQ